MCSRKIIFNLRIVTHPSCGADLTVVTPYQPTDQTPRLGREIRLAEEKKIKKYTQGEGNYATERRAVIVPLVMTTFGAFCPVSASSLPRP